MTAAWRFCFAQLPVASSVPVTYQGEALLLYHLAVGQTRQDTIRGQFFQALLVAIERMPEVTGLTLHDNIHELTALASETTVGGTEDHFTALVVEKARQQFIAYLNSLTPTELQQVAPLPYRPVSREDIVRDVWRRLYDRWGIRDCWFLHIDPETTPGPVIEFFTDDVFSHCGEGHIREILRAHGIAQVWEISAWNDEQSTVKDLSQVEFFQGYEHFWTAEPMDWLIYLSHEDTMAFAGDWLIEAILASWPGWSKCWHVLVKESSQ